MTARIRTDWKRGAARASGKRVGADAWDKFLFYLETMSATEASKRPGMPSRMAFNARRKRHQDFDQRASAIMSGRRLINGGRKRIAESQWREFLAHVDSCCVKQLCAREGMPSQAWVYKRRRTDSEFAARLSETLRARWKLRLAIALNVRFPGWYPGRNVDRRAPQYRVSVKLAPPGEAFRAQLASNDLYRAAMAAVPAHLDQAARDDIAADMMLAVLEGRIERSDLKARAREFTRAHWKLFGTIGVVSLDAPAYPGAGFALIETIAAPDSASHQTGSA